MNDRTMNAPRLSGFPALPVVSRAHYTLINLSAPRWTLVDLSGPRFTLVNQSAPALTAIPA